MKKSWIRFVLEMVLVVAVLAAAGFGIFKLVNGRNANWRMIVDREYWDFETRVGRSTDIVKATYEKAKPFTTKSNDGSIVFEGVACTFTVQERFRGDAAETIEVWFFKYSSDSYSLEAAQYEEGKEYYLLLTRSTDVLRHDYYTIVSRSTFLPADDMENARVDGEPLEQHATAESITQLKADPAAFFESRVDTEYLEAQYKPIYETDLPTVVTGSKYVLKVRVEKKSSNNGFAFEREDYVCQVVTTIKGDVSEGEQIEVLFPTKAVSPGDEVIVAVHSHGKGFDTEQSFSFTSRASLMDVSQEEEIRQVLAQE